MEESFNQDTPPTAVVQVTQRIVGGPFATRSLLVFGTCRDVRNLPDQTRVAAGVASRLCLLHKASEGIAVTLAVAVAVAEDVVNPWLCGCIFFRRGHVRILVLENPEDHIDSCAFCCLTI